MLKNINVWIVITVVYTTIGYSQESIPEIITPTPEAASLGKYGNTPVSKYTGVPNISIPLYTITEGDITVPITLNYHAGGFRVQEEATWVGLGWSLSAGGSISRDTRGTPDLLEPNLSEFSSWGENDDNVLPVSAFNLFGISQNAVYDRYGIDRVFRQPNQHQHIFDMSNYFKKETGIGAYAIGDYQADHFNYSYPGGSGEFYNQDNQYFISKTKNLIKIEKGSSAEHCEFKITDDNGFVYKYGDVSTNGIEKSYSTTIYNGTMSSNGLYIPMNYKLANITSKNKNKVDFLYENTIQGTDYILSTVSVKNDQRYTPGHLESFEGGAVSSLTESRSRTLNSVLSKIEFTQGYVNFIVNDSSDPRLDIVGDGAKKLEIIEVYKYTDNQGNSELVKRIEFEYSYFIASSSIKYNSLFFDFDQEANSKRLRLDRIKEYGSNLNSDPKVHEFYYDSTQLLPHKTSYSVDKYGYYNGAKNSTYIPSQTIGEITYSGANVEPNPNYVTAGLLEKIVYPTRGSTNFVYEQNEFKVDYVIKKDTIRNSSILTNDSSIDGAPPINNVEFANGSFTINHRQSIYIRVDLIAENTPKVPSDLNVKLFAADNSFSQQWDMAIPNAPLSCNNDLTFCSVGFEKSIMLDPGTYYIETHNFYIENPQTTSYKSIATSTIEYSNRDYNDTSENGPGVRIKEIINKDSNTDIISRKKFEYLEGDNGVSYSSGVLLHKPLFRYLIHDVFDAASPEFGIPDYVARLFYYRTNKPKQSFSSSANGKMLGYNTVTEYNVDHQNLNNGKMVSNYYNYPDDDGLEGNKHGLLNFPNLSSPLNGLLKNETNYKLTGNNYIPVNKKETNYSIHYGSDIKWYGIIVPHTIMAGFNLPMIVGPDTFPICLYPEISTFVGLDSSIEEVFDADDETKSITIAKNYGYQNTQLINEYTTTSIGETKIMRYYYPLTANRPAGLVPQEMIDKNILSPVVVSTVEDTYGENLSIIATDFKIWYGATTTTTNEDDIILPEKIKSLKGVYSAASELEDKIIYHSYDDNGNPLEVSRANGMIVSYIWGHSGKYPIAKIENLDYDSIEGLSEFGDDFSIDTELNASQEAALRGIATAMVTTYKYNPLIGVTSITDPRGYTIYYEYDEFNRLKAVKDKDGNLVSDYQYSYKIPVQN